MPKRSAPRRSTAPSAASAEAEAPPVAAFSAPALPPPTLGLIDLCGAPSARELALAAVARVTAASAIPPAVFALLNAGGALPVGSLATPAPLVDAKKAKQDAVRAAVRAIARSSFASTLQQSDTGHRGATQPAAADAAPVAAGIAASGRREVLRDIEGMPDLAASSHAAPTLIGFATRGGLAAALAPSSAAPATGAAAVAPPPPPPASVQRALAATVDLAAGGGLLAPHVLGPKRAEAAAARAPTAGPQWFGMTAPEMTPALKQELLVRAR